MCLLPSQQGMETRRWHRLHPQFLDFGNVMLTLLSNVQIRRSLESRNLWKNAIFSSLCIRHFPKCKLSAEMLEHLALGSSN